jgi:hypothetical protein
MAPTKIKPLLIAPDGTTAAHVAAGLRGAGVTPGEIVDGGRGWAARARKAIKAAGRQLLVLVPAAKLGRAQLDLAQQVTSTGGAVIAWSAGASGDSFADEWIIDRLLEQRGARTDERLEVLVQAVQILAFTGLDFRVAEVRIQGRPSALADRLRAAVTSAGLTLVARGGSSTAVLNVTSGGLIQLQGASKRKLPLGDPDSTTQALALLAEPARTSTAGTVAGFAVEQDVVDLIVQPPARLLSETASKRLLAAHGIASGKERLCSSPTQATRYASRFSGPVVLKLVRPELSGKLDAGGVATDVFGGAAVRRAFQTLESLAERLGPPAPLGVLVAEQIDGGDRVWVEAAPHGRFGSILLIGPGDRRAVPPLIALSAPPSIDEALRAIVEAGLASTGDRARALAHGIARFGHLVDQLDGRITRAEIHPLVAVDGRDDALALDALVGIAG